MRLLAKLHDRWDLDPATQAALPFDRVIALVNLRRMEIACLLKIINNVIEVSLGFRESAVVWAIPAAILVALLSRRLQQLRSVRVQEAAVIFFVILALTNTIWAVAQISHTSNFTKNSLSGGYLINLLSITMLFVLPPRSLALVVVGAFLVYCPVVLLLPLPNATKMVALVNAGLVSGIVQIAGWLIHAARRSDYEQKRVIRAQYAELTNRNYERDQLMAITAHDLRSPLYGLRNLLDLAARRATTDSTPQIGPIRDAIFGLDGMIGLVSRLLEAHSAEHEPLTAQVTEDIRGHLLAAARRVAPAGDAVGVTVALDLPERPVVTTFDGNALSRILDNLLGNAVRFSPPGTPVRLRCAARDGAAVIEIEDMGPGFDAAGRAAMFTKFHQRDGAAAAKPGTGMGLFIAASFADRMGATLRFRDAEPTGACFSLRIASDAKAVVREAPQRFGRRANDL